MTQRIEEIELVNRLERAIQHAAEVVKRLKGDGSEAERDAIRAADEEVKALTEQLDAVRSAPKG